MKTFLLLSFPYLLLFTSCNAEKVIIDTDAGADDAFAILLLLRAESGRKLHLPQYEIVGITCTYGNTNEENVEINVLKTLTVANRTDIPVYGGAKKPLVGNFSTDEHFGKDGFGEVEFEQEINGEMNRTLHASMALVELTKKYEGNVSVVLLGPMTNVAMAASLDPSFVGRVKTFYAMGSSASGIGFYRPNVEFNFAADPESNFILLNSTVSSQLTLFPWDTGFKANLTKYWRHNVFGKFNSPFVRFLNAIEAISLHRTKSEVYAPSDAMTVATMLWPDIATSTMETNVQAVFDGAARGSVLVDYKPEEMKRPYNAKVIQSIDVDKLKKAFLVYLTCEKIRC